ncbi:MAG: universal stress protein [Bacteroidales bacterium]|jgi:nucleotide-binding universal stress UspA family protein|nr:universal stress protein [Bacteroidales bacterium]NCU36669.1 universal stress protein [Candidatus Falkowbacteria bacterium]MDD2630840.1 universal stress protein [Bacteroidales bacterium]MDD4176443.1 universal stress protein [Bacteroidales bacterium]MDD4741452.1 universal stress protein [Bacteroidales bacterium]
MTENMNNLVLVPTDFTAVGDNAISQAAEAARFLGYKVVVLHVIDKTTKAQLKKESLDETSVEDKLQVIVDDLKSTYGIEAEGMAREGSIFTTISDVAKELGAKLLYLGTHGKIGMQHLTGSYALKVVTSSPAPVIVVQKRSFGEGYHHIVLPITSDSGPWEKTKWAAHIAKQFRSEIHIYQMNGSQIDEAVNQITEYFDKNDVKYTVREAAKNTNFAKQIIDYATSNNADLVMIMTDPDQSFAKFFLGSWDEQIIFNAAQIPVMCINPRKLNWQKIVSY